MVRLSVTDESVAASVIEEASVFGVMSALVDEDVMIPEGSAIEDVDSSPSDSVVEGNGVTGGHKPVSTLDSDVILLKTGGSALEEVSLLNTGLPSDSDSDCSSTQSPSFACSSSVLTSAVSSWRSIGLGVMSDVMRVVRLALSTFDAV